MKNHGRNFHLSALALAVSTVLVQSAVRAEDDEVAAAKTPVNTLELGVSNTSNSSARFGEYNGLNKSGAALVGNFSLRGGDAYGGRGGASQFSLYGSDLGLSSRSLGGTLANQGRWYLGFMNCATIFRTPIRRRTLVRWVAILLFCRVDSVPRQIRLR